jgi:putative transposase
MNQYNPQFHHRRSIRLKGYDYSRAGLYFITLCCEDRICRFGEIVGANGIRPEMILNEYGQIAFNEWIKTTEIRSNVELGEFVIMPNHIHGIIRLLGRGESYSPELYSPESHSPELKNEINNELNSRDNMDELYLPELNNELNTPDNKGVCDTPRRTENIEELHLSELNNELNTPDNKGVCDTPLRNELSDSPYNGGVCDINLGVTDNKGVCDTPLRSPSQTIGAIVRGYKSSVTKQLGLLGFNEKLWQRNYYEHIIRNEQSYQTISEYIINNPSKWKDDKFFMKRNSP